MLREIKSVQTDETMRRFTFHFANTNHWEVRFPSASFIDDAPQLFNDLEKYAGKTNVEPHVVLSIVFPDDYPRSPPFVRVVQPRFQQYTGHITIGGSICAELLTPSHWQDIGCVQLILFLHNLIIDGNGRLDMFSSLIAVPYSFEEAREAFNRVAHDHGWLGLKDNTLSKKERATTRTHVANSMESRESDRKRTRDN